MSSSNASQFFQSLAINLQLSRFYLLRDNKLSMLYTYLWRLAFKTEFARRALHMMQISNSLISVETQNYCIASLPDNSNCCPVLFVERVGCNIYFLRGIISCCLVQCLSVLAAIILRLVPCFSCSFSVRDEVFQVKSAIPNETNGTAIENQTTVLEIYPQFRVLTCKLQIVSCRIHVYSGWSVQARPF